MISFILKSISILLCIYLVFAVLFYTLSNFFLFHHLPASNPKALHAFKLTTSANDQIAVSYFQAPGSKYTILFSHGNGETLPQLLDFLHEMRANGISIIAYDYPGYGESIGKQTVAHINASILAVYEFLIKDKQVKPDHIILMGHSLGSGPSVYLAKEKPIAGLILEGGFASAYRVYSRYPLFPFDKFNNVKYLPEIHVPILIIHGKLDKTVSFYHGLQLYKSANTPKSFLWVEGAGHNDVRQVAKQGYWDAIKQFIANLPRH